MKKRLDRRRRLCYNCLLYTSKAIIIVLCCLVGLVLVLLLGIRGYFRIPVSEYYKNSEKAFVIPGLSDGMTHQGLASVSYTHLDVYKIQNPNFVCTVSCEI